MSIIYVAGPYSANNVIDVLKNIGRGQHVCAHLFNVGFNPFCPWHDHHFITDNPDCDAGVDRFYEYSIEFLKVSDAIFLIDGWKKSSGAINELVIARELDIPVFEDVDELIEWGKKEGKI